MAIANADTDVTANQNVTLGPSTNLSALHNINLLAGDNPLPQGSRPSPLLASANAQPFAREFIGIPVASATTNLASNATLIVGAGAQIKSGENATLSADPGTPVPEATGVAHGYELYFIPATSGSSTPNGSTSSAVTVNGTVTAGAYHELNITIPNDGSAGAGYSSTVNVNPDGAAYAAFLSDFQYFTTTIDNAQADGAFSNPAVVPALLAGVYNGLVGAMVLGPLFAAGGDVTVNAGTLNGTGTITAYGGPAITVTNDSPDYLVLGSITIPDEPGGNILYTGQATAPPSSMHIIQSGARARPVVSIQELYNQPVPATNTSGPSVFLTAALDNYGNVMLDPNGAVNNQAGQVAITVAHGSLVEAGSLNALQVNISVVNGTYAIANPFGLTSTGSAPTVGWDSTMFWPDGIDPITSPLPQTPSARTAVATVYADYVANVLYNANGQFGTSLTTGSENGSEWQYNDLTAALLGFWPNRSQHCRDRLLPACRKSSRLPVWCSPTLPWSDNASPSQDSDATASAASLGGAGAAFPPYAYHISSSADDGNNNDANEGIFSVIPVFAVPITTRTYAQQTGASSSINAGAVYIDAKYIDVDGPVNVGQPNSKSVSLPALLNSTIAGFHSDFCPAHLLEQPQRCGRLLHASRVRFRHDASIAAQFDAITNQIVVNNVSVAGGGFIALDGIIMNTTPGKSTSTPTSAT